MGSLDLSKVGMMGGPRPGSVSMGGPPAAVEKEPTVTTNVVAGDDGKVEVDSALSKATVKKGGRKKPSKKAFKIDEDD
jgi:hypothetical protein